jgi:hypothetical protein
MGVCHDSDRVKTSSLCFCLCFIPYFLHVSFSTVPKSPCGITEGFQPPVNPKPNNDTTKEAEKHAGNERRKTSYIYIEREKTQCWNSGEEKRLWGSFQNDTNLTTKEDREAAERIEKKRRTPTSRPIFSSPRLLLLSLRN